MLPIVQKGHRYLELDSIRGIAAFAVVLSHFDATLAGSHPVMAVFCHLLGTGHAAVVLFFLLSGFVLTVPYLGEKRPTYSSFLIKRVCRIYLPYAAAIGIAAALAAHLWSAIPTGNIWIDQTWSKPFSTHLLAEHLIMIGHVDYVQWNTVIWTLIIEIRISFVFPALLWAGARLRPLTAIIAFTFATYMLALFKARSGHGILMDTVFYMMFFIVGSLLSRHHEGCRAFLLARTRLETVILFIAGVLCYQFGEHLGTAHFGVSSNLAFYLSEWVVSFGGMTLLMLSTTLQSFRHSLHNKILLWVGSRSFSMYLLHTTILFTLLRLHHGFLTPLWLPVYLVVVLASMEVFYRTVETPALLLGRKLGHRTVATAVKDKILVSP